MTGSTEARLLTLCRPAVAAWVSIGTPMSSLSRDLSGD
jgi:hypothetical protein